MKYHSNIIFLLMQLLHVQTDNLNSNYFYQNPLTATNQPTFLSSSSFRTKDRSSVSYFKSQTTTPITSMHTPYHSNKRSIYEPIERCRILWDYIDKFKVNHRKSRATDHYERGRKHSTYYQSKIEGEVGIVEIILSILAIIFFSIFFVIGVCWMCSSDGNPATHNRHIIELVQTLAQSGEQPIYSESRLQNIHHFRERHRGAQSLVRCAPLINSTRSTEQQLLENGNFNLRRTEITSVAQCTSRLLSPDDYAVPRNLGTIIMEEQSLQPPSYDDFMQKNTGTV